MTYQRIEGPSDLPPAGAPSARARETHELDFKSFADRAKVWEHAKDVAAFANALGGVLLVGADDNSGELRYPGLKSQTVADVKSIYETAAKACSPTVVVDVVPVTHPSGAILVAVNVDPHVDFVLAPAGTRDKNGSECLHTAAWTFPMRRASVTEWLDPETAEIFMNRDIRRAVVLLSRVPAGSRVTVHYPRLTEVSNAIKTSMTSQQFTVEDLSFTTNRVRLASVEPGNCRLNIPLLDVLDAWEAKPEQWAMRIAGEIHAVRESQLGGPVFEYRPIPRRQL